MGRSKKKLKISKNYYKLYIFNSLQYFKRL